MKLTLLKSTAIAAVLSAGLATGAIAENSQATSGAQTQAQVGTSVGMNDVLNARVVAKDETELGRVINVYQAPETADSYLIVDRGATFAAETRYVPVRQSNLRMVGDNTLGVMTTRAEFDTAPAYDATRINEVEMWPPRIQEFWHDKYAADEPISVTVSEAVNVRPRDLSQNAPGYQEPGATPSN